MTGAKKIFTRPKSSICSALRIVCVPKSSVNVCTSRLRTLRSEHVLWLYPNVLHKHSSEACARFTIHHRNTTKRLWVVTQAKRMKIFSRFITLWRMSFRVAFLSLSYWFRYCRDNSCSHMISLEMQYADISLFWVFGSEHFRRIVKQFFIGRTRRQICMKHINCRRLRLPHPLRFTCQGREMRSQRLVSKWDVPLIRSFCKLILCGFVSRFEELRRLNQQSFHVRTKKYDSENGSHLYVVLVNSGCVWNLPPSSSLLYVARGAVKIYPFCIKIPIWPTAWFMAVHSSKSYSHTYTGIRRHMDPGIPYAVHVCSLVAGSRPYDPGWSTWSA